MVTIEYRTMGGTRHKLECTKWILNQTLQGLRNNKCYNIVIV